MIHFTKGDMFEVDFDIRVNTVNCQGVMGAGVALAFRKKYPEMFNDYKQACLAGEVMPGRMHVWKGKARDWVVNFPTKRTWREKSRYEDIASGLSALRKYLIEFPKVKVALPALGCGNGGLDWKRVAPMIEAELQGLDAEVFVYEPADSIKLGRKSLSQSNKIMELELQELGFNDFDISNVLPTHPGLRVQVKGNAELLSIPWIAIFTSLDIGAREFSALVAIAEEIKQYEDIPPIAFLYRGNAVEDVAHEYLKRGLSVILLLPFSPLAKKRVGLSSDPNNQVTYAILSVSEDSGNSAVKLQKISSDILFSASSSVLISDPEFFQKEKEYKKKILNSNTYFIRYERHSPELVNDLEGQGVRPIGRRAETGTPNLLPLITHMNFDVQVSSNKLSAPENVVALLRPSQLRRIADILESASLGEEHVLASFALHLIPQELQIAIKEVLNESGVSEKL